jgi:hypothetical protein
VWILPGSKTRSPVKAARRPSMEASRVIEPRVWLGVGRMKKSMPFQRKVE